MRHLARRQQPEQGELVSGHDIAVLGASTGGVEALSQIVANLPADLPAAVFVVLHVPASTPSHLPQILNRPGPLKALHPTTADPTRHRPIYAPPPRHHLLLH